MAAVVIPLAFGLMAGCGDDDDDPADEPNDAEDVTESAAVRVVAEALRVTVAAEDLEEGEHPRDVAILEEAVADLPGEPEVSGIEDGDGDGRDDDGLLEVHVDEEVACVSVSDAGEVDVTGGAC